MKLKIDNKEFDLSLEHIQYLLAYVDLLSKQQDPQGRRRGKTTRLVDLYIQELFINGEVTISDHGSIEEDRRIFQSVYHRIRYEHPKVELRLNYSRLYFEIVPPKKSLLPYCFTCGQVHSHELPNGNVWNKDSVLQVNAVDRAAAEERVFSEFGAQWAFSYEKGELDMSFYPDGVCLIIEA